MGQFIPVYARLFYLGLEESTSEKNVYLTVSSQDRTGDLTRVHCMFGGKHSRKNIRLAVSSRDRTGDLTRVKGA